MQFNSWEFVVFFGAVYAAYLAIPRVRVQNAILLVASYYFYGKWDWRFLSLLFASTVLDYCCGLRIDATDDRRKRRVWLVISMAGNLTMLGFFKYCNFFIDSLGPLLAHAGFDVPRLRLDIVLPVGISFYTFQTMSYAIDIYRRELKSTRRFFDFALFVTFFPQLVAGPIERASNLLPQCLNPRTIDRRKVMTGLWLIFFGLWKKIVIADNMAFIADEIYENSAQVSAIAAYLGTVAFALQIYCDFAAYSDIARGTASLMGFDLMLNFDHPYAARNPSDFWRRWHISLSTWLRDYLYIPLGGNRGGPVRTYRNLALTMVLGGLWHGAAWNFVAWGAYHGLLLIVHRLWTGGREAARAAGSLGGRLASIFVMFQFTLLGWLLFRSTRSTVVDGRRIDESFEQMREMLSSFANGLGLDAANGMLAARIAAFGVPLMVIEIAQLRARDDFCMLRLPRVTRAAFVGALVFAWLAYGVQSGSQFIYFQF